MFLCDGGASERGGGTWPRPTRRPRQPGQQPSRYRTRKRRPWLRRVQARPSPKGPQAARGRCPGESRGP
eukprot:8059726-Alexandrium_andersonii.AAC.1